MSLRKGGNTVVETTELRVALGWRDGPGVPGMDAWAVLLSGRQVRDDEDVVSAQVRPCRGAVRYEGQQRSGRVEHELLSLDLAGLDRNVDRVLLALSSRGAAFRAVADPHVELRDPADGTRLVRFDCADADVETVLLLGEVYRRGNQWKFRALGQGFSDGLSALARDVGIQRSAVAFGAAERRDGAGAPLRARLPRPRDDAFAPSGAVRPLTRQDANGEGRGEGDGQHPSPPTRYAGYRPDERRPDALPGPSHPAPAAGRYVPLRTGGRYAPMSGPGAGRALGEPDLVVLTPGAAGASLTKRGVEHGTLRVNLNWSMPRRGAQQPTGGFFQWLFGGEPRQPRLDLDLCCLWELRDGRKGVIQPTGNRFGALYRPPYVRLDKDDRTGATEEGENLDINLEHSADFRRLLVFSVIYEGAGGYGGMDAGVLLYPPHGPAVEVRLDQTDELTRMCAIALIENVDGELLVHREVRHIPGNEADVDRAYGWGLRWSRGYK